MAALSTKADDIAILLEQEIVSGVIPPGSVLRQEQLSKRFDVSRTPIREALRRLGALGLVAFEPHRGVRVRSLSRSELRDAFLVRAELEGLAAELAATRMTDDDLDALDAAERRFSDLTGRLRAAARQGISDNRLAIEWMDANYTFHDVIYEASGHPYVARVARSARRALAGQFSWIARGELDDLYARNDAQHRALREALAARSAVGARAIAHEHVLSSGELLETILSYLEIQ